MLRVGWVANRAFARIGRRRCHSTRTGATSASVGCCHGRSGRLLCSAPAPDLKVGVLATTTCAPKSFGVAHDSGVIAGEHPVVARGAAVAAAVGGSGRVQGDGSAQVVRSGIGLSWLIVTRRRSCSRAFEGSWLRAGMSRPMWRSTHDGGRAAAKISQLLLHPCPFSNLDCGKRVCRGQPAGFVSRSMDVFASHIIYI